MRSLNTNDIQLASFKQSLPHSYLFKTNQLSDDDLHSYLHQRLANKKHDADIVNSVKHEKLNTQFCKAHHCIVLFETQDELTLGMVDPLDFHALNKAYRLTQKRIQRRLIHAKQLKHAFNYQSAQGDDFFKQLLEHAVEKNASDIHIEPKHNHFMIRLRIDGLLQYHTKLNTQSGLKLINQIKTAAKLDIAEKRKPQDGRLKKMLGQYEYDFRINCCPNEQLEKIVIRVLKNAKQKLNLQQLGLLPEQLDLIKKHCMQAEGLILVCGPTGSGKTITLYALLEALQCESKNLISIEDPVEIKLNYVNQMAINPAIGLDFSDLLRASLRQDPDIIMLGEIRDQTTADITLKAAQTGHLVLSTLHCNRAIDAFSRMQQLGVSPYDLAHNIKLIISQRLIRLLCNECKGVGCDHCFQGYCGRQGVFELLTLNDAMKTSLLNNHPREMNAHLPTTFVSLDQAVGQLIQNQNTTQEEMIRVL